MALQERNIAVDPLTGDLALTADGSQILFTETTVDTLEQRIRTRLQTFRGEWYLNEGLGVPYFEEVMLKNPDVDRVRALLMAELAAVPGVGEIMSFVVAFDREARRFTVNFKCRSAEGETVEGSI